ncbi:DUF805 domain-containing protein [Pontivivens ytuae]|uniref:DUF805 domain-containing protein n=1 Tax=Pontivivens ytuae TaxID=2789856 RepID=A0A7S9QDT2_9RHOB|nr:DUF805 domain-containing protein [Pontivivens ytuae]
MGPREAIVTCLSSPLRFSGRAERSEYWWFLPVGLTLPAAALLLGASLHLEAALRLALFAIAGLPLFAVTIRRAKDTGTAMDRVAYPTACLVALIAMVCVYETYTAWLGSAFQTIDGPAGFGLMLIAAISVPTLVVAILAALIHGLIFGTMLFSRMILPSDPGTNRYGPPPPHILSRNGPTGPQPE